MYQHNTIVSGFILVNDATTNAALQEARAEIGEAGWKAGYTEERSKVARAALKKHGAPVLTKLSGTLSGVFTPQTKDAQGNVFQKVRVFLNPCLTLHKISSITTGSCDTQNRRVALQTCRYGLNSLFFDASGVTG